MATQTTEPMTKEDSLRAIGAGAYSSIAEMVAALECDYDRLEELRDERDGFETQDTNGSREKCAACGVDSGELHADDCHGGDHKLIAWAEANPDDAEELKELEEAAAGCDANYPCKDRDDAERRIQEDALSVRIFGERTNGEWEADRFEILLTTGGPAVRIMGELDANGEPSHAWLESQDWGTPWQEYYTTGIRDTLLAYCRCFYFGE